MVLALEKDKFISGCVVNGISQKIASELFGNDTTGIQGFAKYCFNACLPGYTNIVTKDNNIISIDNIIENINDNTIIIKSYNTETKEIINDECLEVIYAGEQDIYEIILSNGNSLECTL